MVISYNLIEFGNRVKNIRKSLNLTQKDVMRITRINKDTLRKIESGVSVPKLHTLFLLSNVYKVDLIDVFKTYANSQLILKYYRKIDYILATTDNEKLLSEYYKQFINDTKEMQHEFIDNSVYLQFKLFLEAISIYYNSERIEKETALSILISALKLTNSDFDLENFLKQKYSYFELRILFIIGSIHGYSRKLDFSNDIFKFILSSLDKTLNANLNEKHLLTKIYSQISNNYYRGDKFYKSLQWANEGISYCVRNNIMTNLYYLYARKGAALFYLKDDEYMKYFNLCLSLLEISNNKELESTFRKIIEERYKQI